MINSTKKTQGQIESIKKEFDREKKKIRENFFKNNNGIKNSNENSDLIDKVIRKIFFVLEKKEDFEKEIVICAVGGYGRRQLSPFSDVDLLFGYNKKINTKTIEKIVQFFLYPMWDMGLKVGYAVRNFEEIVYFSKKDHVIKTSLLDARLICGPLVFFSQIMNSVFKEISKKTDSFIKQKIDERKENIIKIGFDYFRNEPNIKESEGSLRDINLIYWSLKIYSIYKKKNAKNPESFLTNLEKNKVKKALEFLMYLRCHIHYASKRSNEKLSFELQKILSEKLSFKFKNAGSKNLVELMMQEYFQQIKNVRIFTQIIIGVINKNIKKKTIQSEIILSKEKIINNLTKKIYKSEFDFDDQRFVINNLKKIKRSDLLSKNNLKYFKKILFSESIEKILLFNDVGLLGKIIPEFSKIDSLPQFDRFHSLTVGQHTLKALSTLKLIYKKRNDNYKFASKILEKKFNKNPLYYAILLHDIGKGMGGEHQKKGALLAEKIVLDLKESNYVAQETSWLIENHLLMSEFAFKKDLEDYSVIKKISLKIKNSERLYSLYLLTVADISAVDHGIWNEWKASLLETLFTKIRHEINEPIKQKSLNEKIDLIKEKVLEKSNILTKDDLKRISKITYPNYWLLQSSSDILYQIENFLLKKKKENINCFIKKGSLDTFLDVTIVAIDKPLLFLNIISIFFSENFSILEARIFTLDDGTVIDTFKISYQNRPFISNDEKKLTINNLIKRFKNFENNKEISFKKNLKRKKSLHSKTNINFDNKSSSTYTVLEVISNDRPGLLFDISKVLIQNNIIISMAKISTNGDFVEDSFHLRNKFGLKIDSQSLIEKLEKEICNSLEEVQNNVS